MSGHYRLFADTRVCYEIKHFTRKDRYINYPHLWIRSTVKHLYNATIMSPDIQPKWCPGSAKNTTFIYSKLQ